MAEKTLSAGPWLPDGIERDSAALRSAKNVLPVYKSYRLVPEVARFSESPDTVDPSFPLTGGVSHLIDLSQAISFLRPVVDVANTPPPGYVPRNPALSHADSVNSTEADASEFIYARSAVPGDFHTLDLGNPGFTVPNDTNHVLRFQYQVFDIHSVGWTVEVTLQENGVVVDPGADPVIKTITGTGDSALVFDEIALSIAQAGAIVNYDELEITIRGTMDVAPVTKDWLPNEDFSNAGAWDTFPAGDGVLWDKIDDFGDVTEGSEQVQQFVHTDAPNPYFQVNLQDLAAPIILIDHKIKISALVDSPLNAQIFISLQDFTRTDDVNLAGQVFQLTNTLTTFEYTLTVDEMSRIGSYSNLNFYANGIFVTDEFALIRVSAVALETPDAEGAIFTWCEFQVPSEDSQVESDSVRRYVGDQERIYEVRDAQNEWTDVSRVALYSQGGEIPQSWSMASWGQDVVATNFVDQVQIKQPGDAVFSDMITTPDKPRGKYVAVIQNHVVLANIHPESDTSNVIIKGLPDMFWWSGRENSSQFFIADLTTQSGLNRCIETPGAINGFVGGEWGTIFKRTSIYRINYIGTPFIFGKDILSRNIGTHYPRSIVQVGQDIYFLDFGGIYRISNGEQLELVGDGQVLRYLFDGQYESEAIDQSTSLIGLERSSSVVGSYVPIIDCIWWMYRRKDDAFNACTRILCYSLREDRFTQIDLPDLSIPDVGSQIQIGQTVTDQNEFDHLMGEENLQSSNNSLMRALLIYTWDRDTVGSAKRHACWTFTSPVTMAAELESHILSSRFVTGRDSKNIQINAVRPIFSMLNRLESPPGVTVTFTSSESPHIGIDPRTSVATGTETNQSGWMTVNPPLHCGYFSWKIEIPRFTSNDMREFLGLEIQYEIGGGE